MTTTVSATLTAVENAFKSILWDPMIIAGENWLDVEAPFLELPVIKTLSDDAIQAISDALFTQLVTLVDITTIRLVNEIHQAAWAAASEKLSILASEQGVSSSAYQQALASEAASFSALVHT